MTAVQTCHDANQPMDRMDVKNMVKEFLDSIRRQTVFKDNRPGKDWMRAFCQRQPDLALRGAEVLTQNRSKNLSEPVLEAFFQLVLLPMYQKCGIDGPMDAGRIWNLDEVGVTPNPVGGLVFAGRGTKNVYSLTPNGVKKMTTVLCCCSAAGQFLPPMVLYKGKYLQSTHVHGGPKGTVYSVSDSG